MTVVLTPRRRTAGEYRHEALLYSGIDEFLEGTSTFIRRAVNAGDPILVVVSKPKIDLLRRELGDAAARVRFADMADVGDNPGRIIAAWQGFVAEYPEAGQLWGIGEPISPDRSPMALAECQLHEALLNVAFDACTPFWLMCPYDLEALTEEVIEEAHRTHPFVAHGDERRSCERFQPVDQLDPFGRPLGDRPSETVYLAFEAADLRSLRVLVARHGRQAGLSEEAIDGYVLAVHEVATNSLRHGGGRGELRIWADHHALVCEVSDHGHITAPLIGRLRPDPSVGGGRGLWIANQLCDLVQIQSTDQGTSVRIYHRI